MATNKTETNDTHSSSPPATRDPQVQLGHMASNGISASIDGLVELGTTRRPEVARQLRGKVELRFREDFAPRALELR